MQLNGSIKRDVIKIQRSKSRKEQDSRKETARRDVLRTVRLITIDSDRKRKRNSIRAIERANSEQTKLKGASSQLKRTQSGANHEGRTQHTHLQRTIG